ncbi:MAG: helix-turn-helix domain-containing protein [Stomatobaculum sp.]
MTAHAALFFRIQELCDLQNITLYELAKRAGLPKSTLLSAVRSNGNPSLGTLAKIADGFQLTLREFFDSELFER